MKNYITHIPQIAKAFCNFFVRMGNVVNMISCIINNFIARMMLVTFILNLF